MVETTQKLISSGNTSHLWKIKTKYTETTTRILVESWILYFYSRVLPNLQIIGFYISSSANLQKVSNSSTKFMINNIQGFSIIIADYSATPFYFKIL